MNLWGWVAVHIGRAPRSKKRFPCEILYRASRYTGFAIDISASGLFVQTNVKPSPGAVVEVRLSLPGVGEPVSLQARVARKKTVPPQLLAVAKGGVGLAITRSADAYLDFLAGLSPEQAESVEHVRRRRARGESPATAAEGEKAAPKRFRAHAVETATGRKSTYMVTSASEADASDEVLEQLGDDWQVLFVERA